MNMIDAYIHEFEQESETTRRVLESVPEDRYGWRANEKGMSIGELCHHIAELVNNMPDVIGGESFDIGMREEPAGSPSTRAELLAAFDAAKARAAGWMAGLGEGAGETWKVFRGDTELMSMPRAAAIRFFLLNHLYHHRGQLSAYLRACGAAVPSVYGPTADVNPFEEEAVPA